MSTLATNTAWPLHLGGQPQSLHIFNHPGDLFMRFSRSFHVYYNHCTPDPSSHHTLGACWQPLEDHTSAVAPSMFPSHFLCIVMFTPSSTPGNRIQHTLVLFLLLLSDSHQNSIILLYKRVYMQKSFIFPVHASHLKIIQLWDEWQKRSTLYTTGKLEAIIFAWDQIRFAIIKIIIKIEKRRRILTKKIQQYVFDKIGHCTW